jgi:membrane protease YdiL (CAAX protease family)
VSIAGSSVLFMALHLYQSTEPALLFVLGLATLTLGVLNAVIVYVTQRLGPAIVAHMVYNGISVATLFLVGGAA